MKPWLGHIGIIDVEQSPQRFRIRLAGTHIVEYYEQDNTGRYIDDLVPADDRDGILRSYVRCAETRTPQFTAAYSNLGEKDRYLLRRLLLPVTVGDRNIDQIIVGIYAEYFERAVTKERLKAHELIGAVEAAAKQAHLQRRGAARG